MKGVVNGYTIQRFSSCGRNGIFIHYLKDGNILHILNIMMLMTIRY